MQPLNVKTPGGSRASGEAAIQGTLNGEQVTPHGTMELHPLCELFPRLINAELAALKADTAANGLNQPIVVHDGQVLDGGNRYRACLELGIDPPMVQYQGHDPIGFVMSANMHRRHLTPGQQAVIVASAQDWELAQTRGGDRKSNQTVSLPFDSVAVRAATSVGGQNNLILMSESRAMRDKCCACQCVRNGDEAPLSSSFLPNGNDAHTSGRLDESGAFCFPELLFGSAREMRPVRPADKKTGALTDKPARELC